MAEKQGVSELDTIILSLHERWWKKMLAGEKILEIRKTAPTKKDREYRVLVYVTGGGGVCGEFICTDFMKIKMFLLCPDGLWAINFIIFGGKDFG